MLRGLVVYGTYPLCLIGSVVLGLALLQAGLPAAAVVIANGLVFAPLCFALERWMPETPHWKWSALELRTDVLHALISNTIPSALFRLLFQASLVGVAASLEGFFGAAVWPVGAPLVVQLGLALLVAEAASYAVHRTLHETRLWPLHAVHHCSPHYYFLLVTRKHPLQAFFTYGARLSLLWMLGVPGDVLALYTGVTAANGYVQHTNVRMRTGWLGWIFATPELHRLHHSRLPEDANSNYGDVLIVWDVLFGTRVEPGDPERLYQGVGIAGPPVDQSYRGHLELPFRFGGRSEG
ncbi:MAG: sterol desaturase family protein [Myxococcota bacterium]|nr:sterol desaturase family protein [Myxococcota bacterium]